MVKINPVRSRPDKVSATSTLGRPLSNGIKPRYSLWFVAILSIAFFLFALSFLLSSAKIVISPKIKAAVLNESLSATKDTSADNNPFDLVVISGEENKKIQGTEEKDVMLKAKGVVVLYNAFSANPQNLSINTQLSGSNGKIYKTDTKITIPGMTKNGTPSSIEVGIIAAEAGVEYNSAPLDFTILGFKGTPKYSKFYGRSKGEIKGGFTGKIGVVSPLEETRVRQELRNILQAKLLKKATDQIPSGFILFKDATFLKINDDGVDIAPSTGNTVMVNAKGTLYGFLFNEKKLTKKIAENIIEKYDGSEVYIPNIKNLNFSLTPQAGSSDQQSSFDNMQNISFNLSGPFVIVWKVDEDKFLNDILGKNKADFNQILSQYQNIDSASLTLSPFWRRSIPENKKDVQIIVNYPK